MRWKRINLLRLTTGPLKPSPTWRCQRTGGPSAGHAAARLVAVQDPFRFGLRHWNQSAERRSRAKARDRLAIQEAGRRAVGASGLADRRNADDPIGATPRG